jgi:hypothetical protein
MTIGSGFRKFRFAACVTMAMTCGAVGAVEVPLVDGTLWIKSSEDVKKAYLVGLANMVQVEAAYNADNPLVVEGGFSPRVARGMKEQTLGSVLEALTNGTRRIPSACSARWSRPSGSKWWCPHYPRPSKGDEMKKLHWLWHLRRRWPRRGAPT